MTRKGYRQAKTALRRFTLIPDLDPPTSLAEDIISIPADETNNYRVQGRVCAAEYKGKVETLLEKLRSGDSDAVTTENELLPIITKLMDESLCNHLRLAFY